MVYELDATDGDATTLIVPAGVRLKIVRREVPEGTEPQVTLIAEPLRFAAEVAPAKPEVRMEGVDEESVPGIVSLAVKHPVRPRHRNTHTHLFRGA
jgi:hypothetical protein